MHDLILYTGIFLTVGSFYYFILSKKFDGWAFRHSLKLPIAKKHPAGHVFALANIAVAGFFQSLVFAGLCCYFATPWKSILVDNFRPIQLAYGIFLGLADIVACNMGGLLFMRAWQSIRSRGAKNALAGSQKQVMSGWVNSFKLSFENFPLAVAGPIAFFYILFEELIFRGVVLFAYAGISGIPVFLAILLSTLLFTLAQRPGIPRARDANYPMRSAFIMGLIHNWLMLKVFSIVPLIIAHFVFLLVATLPVKKTGNKLTPNADLLGI
ncbi:MAG TPA: CPBP family intramembrane glutamic endopeptidase [Puia sp.]|jgi:membrane protease YdiL (CAAX protease family)|nr:CPBP family intramembrane glutamic endopeptidase [Puia sp.]